MSNFDLTPLSIHANVSLSKIVKIWEDLGIKDLTSIFALRQCAPLTVSPTHMNE